MDAGINNVIYMELHSGPKMANSTCGNDRSRFHCINYIQKYSLLYLFLTTKCYLVLTVHSITFCDSMENLRHLLQQHVVPLM